MVIIPGPKVGVLVRWANGQAVVMAWVPEKGRWLHPEPFDAADVQTAPATDTEVQRALSNIRRHHGVIPHGMARPKWVRVWPSGTPPA